MPRRPTPVPPPGCYVISLRPVGGHAAVRAAAAQRGLRTIALSPWRIEARADGATRVALRDATRADVLVFTSPNAVHAAAAIGPLRPRRGQAWCAVGAGTAAALARAGIADAARPARMDSAGLLALPALQGGTGRSVGLVTAPGGRDRIAPALARRGFAVRRADVYGRVPLPLRADALARLRAAVDAPWCLLLTSGEALDQVLAALPDDLRARLLEARILAASQRLADLARAAGARDLHVGTDPRPAALLALA